jgi:acyl carrier protein
MIPRAFVRLDALPLTTSGKLDRPALPAPGPDNGLDRQAFRAPRTPTEQRLAGIVAELLGIAAIGADDNFFLLGVHSLLGTQVVLRAREAFGIELSLRHLFEAETVATLAEVVERLLIEKLETMTDEEAGALAVR